MYAHEKGASGCKNCSKYTYSSLVGQSYCNQCIPGMYNDFIGQSNCTQCKIGYYCIGNDTKVGCPKGTYLDRTNGTSETSCLRCNMGTYNDLIGQSSCKKCNIGMYADMAFVMMHFEIFLLNIFCIINRFHLDLPHIHRHHH